MATDRSGLFRVKYANISFRRGRIPPGAALFSEAPQQTGQAVDEAEVAKHLRRVCDTAKAELLVKGLEVAIV